ncbi:MAG: hypothetical protein AAGC76_05185 [Luteibacter sp.]|uniref:hypothetical protein n=1 Tax=Luteibacter sp. TaxID=1886636 RepID=UPI0028074D8B|nr:hypothetical protein [Luteibacter sp.]MDQ7995231.1 hypothetical protein [Luteibacter sp.]
MKRMLIVSYKPLPGKRQELLDLLAHHHRAARAQGRLSAELPWLGEGVNGDIVFIVSLDGVASLESIWEDELLQDIEAAIAGVARMVPLRSVVEADAAFVDLASLPIRGA